MGLPSQFSLIQTVNPSVSTGTITATLTDTLVGSLILVFVGASALTDTVATVTDNANNPYTKVYGQAGGSGGDTELWYSRNSQPTTSVVVTFSASVSTKSVFVREYSGMAVDVTVLDQQVSTNGSGTSVSSGATSSTIYATELVVSSCSCLGTNPTLSVGAGFGNFTSQAIVAAASIHAIEDLTVTTTGTQTGIMTAGGTLPLWDVGVATFVVAQGKGDTLKRHFIAAGMGQTEEAS